MKNRTFILICFLIFLAALGVIGKFINDPIKFIQGVAIFAVVGFIIFLVVRNLFKAGPNSREQQAFRKAAKKSQKRFQHNGLKKNTASISSVKKAKTHRKSSSHLTVIDGKKGKKKDRATF